MGNSLNCSIYCLILTSLLFFLGGCTEKEFDPADPAKSFTIAREPYDDENFEIAVQRLGEFKSRFPYSKYATIAELFIANSHFELGNYEEAAVSYSQFVKLHPNNEKVDFAMYRIGESYWIDSPEEVDREQEFTHKAIEEWEKLVKRFPQSQYTKKAQKFIAEGQRRIAESYEFIADFYCKMEIIHACAYRFELLAEKFPEFKDLYNKSLQQAALALDQLAELKKADPESDKNIYFKTMTAAQIKMRAAELRKRLQSGS